MVMAFRVGEYWILFIKKLVNKVKKIKELQKKELHLAENFVRICEEYNLRYYMIGGTFLGAIRHHGFIPWDDDMDFGMPRLDYEKFLTLINDIGLLRIQHYSLGVEYKYSFMKLVDDSMMIEIRNGKEIQIVPSWIDIFPLDNVPKNLFLKKIHILHLLIIRMLISFKNIDRLNTKKKNRPFYEKILMFLASHINLASMYSLSQLYTKLDKVLKKYPENRGYYWINIMGSYKDKEIFEQAVFGKGKEYTFESEHFVGPDNGDEYLTTLYGDYMKVPSSNNRNHHNSEIL